jgi:flavorubredoxin
MGMFDTTELAPGIFRISMVGETDVVDAGLVLPGSYNMFVIAAQRPALINTMMRRTYERFRTRVAEILDPASIQYLVVSHHEADTDGAINDWLATAPSAVPLATELCAVLSLRDLADRDVQTVTDNEVVDLGTHQLRFLHSPYVNQWDSMMIYEEHTGTLFPNDLFASPLDGTIVDDDPTDACLAAAREFGYMANDRTCLDTALAKIEAIKPKRIAPMHGPVLTKHLNELIQAFEHTTLAHTHH